MLKILLPVGRLVKGHPMIGHPVFDKTAGVPPNTPKLDKNNQAQFNFYHAVAIAKVPGQTWQQSEWGAKIAAQATADWPAGEHALPGFSWKIIDGDDNTPQMPFEGRAVAPPASNEGYPGHWIVKLQNGYTTPCYHIGHLQPTDVITQKEAIKCGDYVQLEIGVAKNTGATPGMYVNPIQCLLYQAGIAIISAGVPDAADTFGQVVAGALPVGALVDPNVPAVAAASAVVPGVGELQELNVAGIMHTVAALRVAGWTEAQLLNGGMTDPVVAALAQQAAAPAPPPAAPAPPPADDFLIIDGKQHTVASLVAAGWKPEQIAAKR